MKSNAQIKMIGADLNWLPPAHEWDFRSITAEECRIACHWEYSRQVYQGRLMMPRSIPEPGTGKLVGTAKPEVWCPDRYHGAARQLFPRPWLALTPEQRKAVLGSFHRLPVVTVRTLGDFLKRMNWMNGIPDGETARGYMEHTFVIQPHFGVYGETAVMAKLSEWAQVESRRYRRRPHAKGASLPFDELKWLAAWRLELARCAANEALTQRAKASGRPIQRSDLILVGRIREEIKAHANGHPQDNPRDVLPIYTSAGAWTKARKDAERCAQLVSLNTSQLLAEWC